MASSCYNEPIPAIAPVMETAHATPSHPSHPVIKLRPRYPRTRQGCLICRQRKKKCDLTKPQCVACNRNKLSCVWPSVAPASSTSKASSNRTKDKPKDLNGRKSDSSPKQHCSRSPGPSSPAINLLATIKPFYGADQFRNHDETIQWVKSTNSFSSPKRAALLTQSSHILLEHYLVHTGSLLATTPIWISPFVTCIVPLSYIDDLLMHAILALSGSHLSFKQPDNLEIQRATYLHCDLVLKGIRIAFQDIGPESSMKLLKLLLVLLMLCHFEVVSGNISGSIFPHLRACHQLIKWLLSDTRHENTVGDKKALGFALEVYAYLTLANTISPYNTIGDRIMPTDPLMTSLGTLSEYETFGTMFAGVHGLFEIIPQISNFHQSRLEEQTEDCSPEDHEKYKELQRSIIEWKLGPLKTIDPELAAQRESMAEIYRHALHIYLETAVSGSIVDTPARICTIQDHVDELINLAFQISESQYCSILLWPLVISGSCMVKETQRQKLFESLTNTRYQMKHCLTARDLLSHLWADTDRRSYGPYGLSLMMQKHNINCCLA